MREAELQHLPTVRGFVIGRSQLFPPDGKVAAVDAVVEMA
jgi:hypothetical protein